MSEEGAYLLPDAWQGSESRDMNERGRAQAHKLKHGKEPE